MVAVASRLTEERMSATSNIPSLRDGGNRRRGKSEVCEVLLRRLREQGDPVMQDPTFPDEMRAFFNLMPSRYSSDVNTDGAEVLTHKRLLDAARQDRTTVAFHVRPVDVLAATVSPMGGTPASSLGEVGGMAESPSLAKVRSVHGRPAFGSSPNLEALAIESLEDKEGVPARRGGQHRPMHEVTLSTVDQPKLLSRLTSLLADIDLNIREAHAFSSSDGYSLDVFVVDGWEDEDPEGLQEALAAQIARWNTVDSKEGSGGARAASSAAGSGAAGVNPLMAGGEDWELDPTKLHFGPKIASGSFGDLFRGVYCGQEVAIKILKDANENTQQLQEFLQEVSIMRKVRHKNVVQFIGACTARPNLCIVFEFMSGGSVYDFLHRQRVLLQLPMLLRVAQDVASAMDYLHQRNIIHRDLKAANLLMDEHETVKVADFGVARVQSSNGVMTAETGTYRWMAPEVIEHKPYDNKADVFSYGVVLWELLTGHVPYAEMTPLQAAVGVVQKGLRPTIPKGCPQCLVDIMNACWKGNSAERPSFTEICNMLQEARAGIKVDTSGGGKDGGKDGKQGFFQRLKSRT